MATDADFTENIACLESVRIILRDELDYPVCELKLANADRLFTNYYTRLDDFAYGEEYSVLDDWRALDQFQSFIRGRNGADLKRALDSKHITLRDAYFLQCFLKWYLSPHLEGQIGSPNRTQSWHTPEDISGVLDNDWSQLKARRTQIDGHGIFNFEDWLGYSD